MSKKILYLIAIFGGILLIAGIIISPGKLAEVTARSEWKLVKIELFKYYLIIIGSAILLAGLLITIFPKNKRLNLLLVSFSAIGIILILIGMMFTPAYSIENFSTTKFLSEDGKARLLFYQVITIILGSLLFAFPLLLLIKRSVKQSKFLFISATLFGILLMLSLLKLTYIDTKYPSNIIFKEGEYKKIVELVLGQDILLSDFDPQSTLKLKRKKILKAKFPVIDVNAHLSSSFRTDYDKKVLAADNLIKSMDSVGLAIVINTDVEGNNLENVLNRYARKYPGRFYNMWPTGFPPSIMTNKRLSELPGELEKAVKMGAVGDGELWKNLGLKTRDETGKVIPVDDPRLDPLWKKAGELNVPFLWHMGDPPAEFLPVNRFNERYVELRRYPEWSFYGPKFPSRETLMKGRENVLRKHPNTIFIGCHMGWNTDDLNYAGYLLDTYPNYYLDLSTTLSELGRQPRRTRKFFIKYQDRIVFGTDGGSLFGVKGWTVEKFYQAYFEFLETDNEYIDYPMQGAINQGSWKIYGINLPDSVLEKIYYKNAEKLFHIKVNQ